MRNAALVLAATVASLVAGCGLDPSPDPSASVTVESARATGAGELVLRVESRGGLLPPLDRERQLPAISIYADGLVLVPAAFDGSFPGPAGFELERFTIDAELLADIVAAGTGIGLRGEDRHLAQEGPGFVADGGATTVTLVTGGDPHVTSADALFDTTDADTAARTQLRDFVTRLFGLRPTDEQLTRYEPAAYRVYVAAPDPGFGAELPDAAPVAWPFEEPIAAWGEPLPDDGLSVGVRCRVRSAAELGDALDVLRAATSATIVVDAAQERAIVAYRPLLPDEEGCARP